MFVFLEHPGFKPDFAPLESLIQVQSEDMTDLEQKCYYSNTVCYYQMQTEFPVRNPNADKVSPSDPSLCEATRTPKSTNDKAESGSSYM